MGIREFFAKKAKQQAVASIQRKDTGTQVAFLREALDTGLLERRNLRRQLERNAVNEMRKGADRFVKRGTHLTVDGLLEEYRANAEFVRLANDVGLPESWFIDLARKECLQRGVSV